MAITLFIYLLCIVLWLGGMIFFSAFVAPVIFTRLPIHQAGAIVSVIFPRYYILGYVAGAISFILALYFAAAKGPRGWWTLATVTLAIALALTVYAGASVRPRVDAIRSVAEEQNPDPVRRAEFDHLHHLSVVLNGAVLGLDIIALIGTAAALAQRV